VLHGGAAGVLFDMFTTTALGPLAKPGYWECEHLSGGVEIKLEVLTQAAFSVE